MPQKKNLKLKPRTMGNTDSMPVISQAKSLVQVIGGDAEGARRTQENFSRQCVGISQARSLVEVSMGDADSARETQKQFVKGVGDTIDGTPALGHLKGGIHYLANDREGGDKAMKAASRTTGVMAGGVAGFCVGGPGGAVAGGIAGGAVMDGITTGVDSLVHGEYRPDGTVANVTALVENPKDPGQWYDTVTAPAFDGLTGMSAGCALKGPAPKAAGRASSVRASSVSAEGTSVRSTTSGRTTSVFDEPTHGTGRPSAASMWGGSEIDEGPRVADEPTHGAGRPSAASMWGGSEIDEGPRVADEPTHGMGKRGRGGGGGNNKRGSNDPPPIRPKPDLEVWHKQAYDLMARMKREGIMPKDGKTLVKFLEEIGYKRLKKKGQGDHCTFELKEKEKLRNFLESEGVNLRGIDTDDLPILKIVSGVDTGGTKYGTVKSVVDRLLGLHSQGQAF